MNAIAGKKALVTGATSGIGEAISLALLKSGVEVFLVGRNFSSFESGLKELNAGEINYHRIQAELTDDSDIEQIVRIVGNNPIDMVVHSAGIISHGNFENLKVTDFDRQYQVNVRAPFLLTQKLLPAIRKISGQIVFINSTAGLDAWSGVSQYSATKHALKAMATSLRKEISGQRIRVTSLYLGSVDTPMQYRIQQQIGSEKYDAEKYMKPEEVAQLILTLMTLPEGISVTDITVKPNI